MIDPDGIQIQETNLSNNISIQKVPDFEYEIYNLEDDKDYKAYIKDVEKEVRRSFEYRQMIKFLREIGMDKCAFLKDVSNSETFDIKIEIHHYPFSLHDIAEIVTRKRHYYNESLDTEMTAKEVMELHYKTLIGLIPLSETVHQLVHASRLFIPVDRVFGRYNLFVDYYKPFCDPEQLDTLERIEKYTKEQSYLLNTTILDMNKVSYNIKDSEYILPNMDTITNRLEDRMEEIKSNNYILPDVDEVKKLTSIPHQALEFYPQDKNIVPNAIEFF